MLIEKLDMKAGDIVTIKLINSDELIAKLVDINDINVTIEKPLLLGIAVNPDTNKPAINMLPFWVMSVDNKTKLTLQRSHILVLAKSNTEAKNGWVQFTSGIVMPGSSVSNVGNGINIIS